MVRKKMLCYQLPVTYIYFFLLLLLSRSGPSHTRKAGLAKYQQHVISEIILDTC